MWAPRSNARRSSRISIPPTQEAITTPVSAYNHCSSRLTCIANSRVGAITRPRGLEARSNTSLSVKRFGAIAIPKPTVLPDPV